MPKISLIIDESGAKGYWTNQEKNIGDFGVMAGFIVMDEQFEVTQIELEKIRSQYAASGKVHITDLPEDRRHKLRDDLFEYIESRQLACVYNAVYVEGYHQAYSKQRELSNIAKESSDSKIRVSEPKEKPSLHTELFLGVFVKGVAFCIDKYPGDKCEIAVITDKVDEPIRKDFLSAANQLLKVYEEETTEVRGYDIENKNIVTGKITTSASSTDGTVDDFSNMSFTISIEDSGLTLCADVICNSLNYHIGSRIGQLKNGCSNLNDANAIDGYRIASNFFGLNENYAFHDTVFRHPSSN